MQTTNNPWLITPDLSEAVETGGQVTPGIYTARVATPELKTSKDGNQYIKWTLEIFGAEGELSKFNKWKVYYNTMLSGKGAGMLKGFYKACTGTEFPGGAFDWSLLVGSEIEITLVEGKPYNGEPSKYPEVKAVKQITH
jgi:hypothetical protein